MAMIAITKISSSSSSLRQYTKKLHRLSSSYFTTYHGNDTTTHCNNNSTTHLFQRRKMVTFPSSHSILQSSTTNHPIIQQQQQQQQQQNRFFHTEQEYHNTADETLEHIQDALEELFEDSFSTETEIPEVNVANGVLTLSLPPHGTWVLNKQTPNQQIWWSSPLSGPRRYEYVELGDGEGIWVYSRYIENLEKEEEWNVEGEYTLGYILTKEIKELYSRYIENLEKEEEWNVEGEYTLGYILTKEIKELYGLDLEL
uniref:ferroxidase n=1 Tax=Ditylum brightwellii TaxID=49249 RepID=A0A7S4QGS3_9STRA